MWNNHIKSFFTVRIKGKLTCTIYTIILLLSKYPEEMNAFSYQKRIKRTVMTTVFLIAQNSNYPKYLSIAYG
jgi:hypothetical protein